MDREDKEYIDAGLLGCDIKEESLVESKEDILKFVEKEVGISDRPVDGPSYIMPSGKFLTIWRSKIPVSKYSATGSAIHRDVQDFLYNKGLVKEKGIEVDDPELEKLGCIRVNSGFEEYIWLPKDRPNEAQWQSLLVWLDWYFRFHSKLTVGFKSYAPIVYYSKDYTTDEILKKCKEAYGRGYLTESKQDIEKFRQWAGDELANRFFKLKDRLPDKTKDIYYWMSMEKQLLNLEDRYKHAQENSNISKYKDWAHEQAIDGLKLALDEIEKTPTRKEVNKLGKEGSEKIYEDEDWLVLKINTYEASVKYGKGTEWCITGNNSDQGRDDFDSHTKDNGATMYFFLNKKNNNSKYALEYVDDENWCLFDETDFPHVGYGTSFNNGMNAMGGECWHKGDLRDTFPVIKGLPDINKAYDDFEKYDEESLREDLQENILDALDKEFGQEDVYMWSTYILPNGHFLNPDKAQDYWDEIDEEPGYEHYDFEDWAWSHEYENLQEIYDNCVKMNVTYPYLGMPDKARPTPEQLNAIRKIINNKDSFEQEEPLSGWYDDFGEDKINAMSDNRLAIFTPKGDEVFDLNVSDADDIIRAINQAYIRGGFFGECVSKLDEDSGRDTFIFKGKKSWSGAVNTLDGTIEEVHSYSQAKQVGFHHSFYFSDSQLDKMNEGDSCFFCVYKDHTIMINATNRFNSRGDDIELREDYLKGRIKEQIEFIDKHEENFDTLSESVKEISDYVYFVNNTKEAKDYLLSQKRTTRITIFERGHGFVDYLFADAYNKIHINSILDAIRSGYIGKDDLHNLSQCRLIYIPNLNDTSGYSEWDSYIEYVYNNFRIIEVSNAYKQLSFRDTDLYKSLDEPEDVHVYKNRVLIEKIVRLDNGKYQVQSEKGKNLGTYNTKKEAEDRLKQVHYFKHINENFKYIDGVRFFDSVYELKDFILNNKNHFLRIVDFEDLGFYGVDFGSIGTHDGICSIAYENGLISDNPYLYDDNAIITYPVSKEKEYLDGYYRPIYVYHYGDLGIAEVGGGGYTFYNSNLYNALGKPTEEYKIDDEVESLQEDLQETDNEGNILSKEQIEFFKNSKVRSNGKLQVVYHGTTENFDTFEKGDIGFHFGTKEASEEVGSFRASQQNKEWHTKGYYLNIKKPLVVRDDIFVWTPGMIGFYIIYDEDWGFDFMDKLHYTNGDKEKIKQLMPEVIITDELKNKYKSKYGGRCSWYDILDNHQWELQNQNYDMNSEATKFIKSLFTRNGYDGIKYRNDYEDVGSYSYIAFESNQIKSIDNKNPTNSDNINESLDEFDSIVKIELDTLNNWLDKYGFEVELITDKETLDDIDWSSQYGSEAVGMFLQDIQDNASVFPIALNKEVISKLCKDRDDLIRGIKGTLWHEAGHGIYRFLEDIMNMPEGEEDCVEEFARYRENSKLFDILQDYMKQDESLNESKEDQQNFINKFGENRWNLFNQFKDRLVNKDIYYWLKKSEEELDAELERVSKIKSNKQVRDEEKAGAKLVYEDDTWKVIRILDYSAMKYYGKGTKWCVAMTQYEGTTGWGWWKRYTTGEYESGEIYVFINKNTKRKYCLVKQTPTSTTPGFGALVYTQDDISKYRIPNCPDIPGVYTNPNWDN